MRVADIAKEFNVTEQEILDRLRALKLKAKDGTQELNKVVEIVLRDDFNKGLAPAKKAAKSDEKKAKAAKTAEKSTKKTAEKKPAKEKAVKAVAKTKTKEKKEISSKAKEEKKQASTKTKKEPVAVKEPPKVEKVLPKVEKPVEAKPVPVAKVELPPAPVKAVAPPMSPLPVPPVAPKPATPAPAPTVASAPTVTPVLKPMRKDEPVFVTVKPLQKKKRRPFEDAQAHRLSDKRHSEEEVAVQEVALAPGELKDLEVAVPISVKDFANRLQQKVNVILGKLMKMGIFANINQSLDEDIVRKLLPEFGFNLVVPKTQEEELVYKHKSQDEDPQLLKPRAPVVTFMGHVDHGKTSLLDRIRKTKVADGEHGGITQHIGAYSVNIAKGSITFLDTPGHEAFTAMRARGAHITDIVVLVVAADEGIMPQTLEAVDHARAANVPIVVALNKMDHKNANADKVKKQLMEHDLAPEDWGGKTVVVGVSAVTGAGIDQLLEMILLEAELLNLKANPDKKASGIVIEAHMSPGRGAMATLIVQGGTLKSGSIVVAGPYYGRIKAMFDDHERAIQTAGPSMPVEVLGLPVVPEAGELFYVVEDEKTAKEITDVRQEKLKAERLAGTSKLTLEDWFTKVGDNKVKELNLIIKTDVQGSAEALKDSLLKIVHEEVKVRIMHTAIGEVNTSDVLLAISSSAIIIAFNVGVDAKAREELEKSPIDVRQYRIIYDAVNDIRLALQGLLAPKIKKNVIGRVEVRQVFKLTKADHVAGSYVQKGKVRSKAKVDVLRNGEVVFTGNISSLKRFKDDVKEVTEGFECGITIDKFDVMAGDILEIFELEEIARKL